MRRGCQGNCSEAGICGGVGDTKKLGSETGVSEV